MTLKQKVITVNINVYENEDNYKIRHYSHEITDVNKYLDEGWTIKQTIQSEKGSAVWTNITFILEKKDPVRVSA